MCMWNAGEAELTRKKEKEKKTALLIKLCHQLPPAWRALYVPQNLLELTYYLRGVTRCSYRGIWATFTRGSVTVAATIR